MKLDKGVESMLYTVLVEIMLIIIGLVTDIHAFAWVGVTIMIINIVVFLLALYVTGKDMNEEEILTLGKVFSDD